MTHFSKVDIFLVNSKTYFVVGNVHMSLCNDVPAKNALQIAGYIALIFSRA